VEETELKNTRRERRGGLTKEELAVLQTNGGLNVDSAALVREKKQRAGLTRGGEVIETRKINSVDLRIRTRPDARRGVAGDLRRQEDSRVVEGVRLKKLFQKGEKKKSVRMTNEGEKPRPKKKGVAKLTILKKKEG